MVTAKATRFIETGYAAAHPHIPSGYKQTEVGVIPEDWAVSRLSEVCAMKSGEAITSANIDQFSKYPCYGGNGLRGFTSCFTHDGRYALIGRQGALCGNVLGVEGKFFASEHAVVVTTSTRTDVRWLTFVLGEMRLNRYSESSAQPGLSVSKLLCLELAVPPTKSEQEAIAGALSDADALIESLDQLIAKKRQIKEGAMQELLTGKKRLPGFEKAPGYKQTVAGAIPVDWEVKLLPDVCRFRGGKAHEQHISDFGQFVCVNSKFISTDGKVRKYSTANFCSAKRDDILMVMSDLPNGKALAKAYVVDQDNLYAVNQRVCALTPYRDFSKYLFYVLNRNPYFLKFDDGVNQTHLLNPVFQKCPLPLPPTKAEQAAIAAILSDMDAEIAALEEKLTKARQIKQGMMQELLTGKVRLI